MAGMAGIRWPPDEMEQVHSLGRGEGARQGDTDASTHYSDDERSVAADSWSVKSEYGSTLDGEDQRNADVVDALNAQFRPADYMGNWELENAGKMEFKTLHQTLSPAVVSHGRSKKQCTSLPLSGALNHGLTAYLDIYGPSEFLELYMSLSAAYAHRLLSLDKEEQDEDVEPSVLGLQSHWDSIYANELVNFHEQGDAGEIWFGDEVMETVAAWTARVCVAVAAGLPSDNVDGFSLGSRGLVDASAGGSMALELTNWNVLDLGTGNGLFLHALAKQGFTDLTGTDYSEGAVELSRAIAGRNNVDNVTFLVDDVLDTKLDRQFKLVTDKGTLDAIGLHPDGPARRLQYWKALSKLVGPGGVVVITSCNSTKDELVAEVSRFSHSQKNNGPNVKDHKDSDGLFLNALESEPTFEYIDHVRTYPTFRFGGVEGSRVSTVAFIRSA